MTFTPGPWDFRENQGSYVDGERGCENEIIGTRPEGLVLACIISDCIPEADDNTRLIAAAPTLYEALQKIADRGIQPPWSVCARIARAALAKAEGRS